MLLVVPVPPLVSTAIGVSAMLWSGTPMTVLSVTWH